MDKRTEHIVEALRTAYDELEARELARWVREELPENADSNAISAAVNRLLQGEPVQYVFEHALWMGLDLRVTPATLIPRPETAELISICKVRFDKGTPLSAPRVLDIGTGSGCIALALKQKHPEWEVSGCDISEETLAVARENAVRNGVNVNFFRCNILHEVPEGPFNLLVSNPPYVCETEKSTMESRVLDYEPASALFVSDAQPLLFYERITTLATNGLLTAGGMLCFEINERFGSAVAELMQQPGFREVRVLKDMFGKDRFVTGIR